MSFVESAPALRSAEPLLSCRPEGGTPHCSLRLHRHGDAARTETERFIAGVYRQRFGARLSRFMPVLAASSVDGHLCAAAGYRSAVEPLFLERYLPQPIEQALAAVVGRRVTREQIVEVGQFASRCAGEGRRLMPALARHLVDAGFRWAVITATSELRRLFSRQGLCALPLAAAQRRCVGDEAPSWGSYYDHAPMVLTGELALNLARLEGRRSPRPAMQ